MNLSKLFQTQKVLDQKIYDRFPGLKEEPWDWKILALLTELGECANEWRGFKKWSKDQKPRTKEIIDCSYCIGTGDSNAESNMEMMMEGKDGVPYEACEDCNETGISGYRNPLLEEYVDCLHFILSIGLEVECTDYEYESVNVIPDNTKAFNFLFEQALKLRGAQKDKPIYYLMLHTFLGFGIKNLGFTWDQIESAYFAKNEVNHVRQAEGY